jgi:hypothetical protein
MGGGLLQLVAYGAQDAYISGNPQITFWKGLFKRHTNFAMEPFRVNFSGQVQWGTKQTALIGRHADLIYSTYVEVVLPRDVSINGVSTPYQWNNGVNTLGYNLIRYVEIDIGGQVIDRLYSEFMVIWAQLTGTIDTRQKLQAMVAGPCLSGGPTQLRYGSSCAPDGRPQHLNVLYIPLPFFFTRNPGAALPLIALQYHEVKINVIWNEAQFIAGNFTNSTTAEGAPGIQYLPQAIQAAIYVDYIYLDTEERRRMAQASHEYLIEQTQFNEDKGIRGTNSRIDLTFNHPVKELIWVVQPSYYTDCRLAADVPVNQSRTEKLTNEALDVESGTAGTGARISAEWDQTTGEVISINVFNGSGYGTDSILSVNISDGVDLYINVTSVDGSGVVTGFTYGSDNAGTNGLGPTRAGDNLTYLLPFLYDQDPVFDQWLQINGQDRLDRRYGDYYNKVQPYQHHSGNISTVPLGLSVVGVNSEELSLFNGLLGGGGSFNGVYCYSFALRPEEHQPSGTCNFSRIDTATIVMNMAGASEFGPRSNDTGDWNVRVYAVNYNVLRIMSGMGGLAYSN